MGCGQSTNSLSLDDVRHFPPVERQGVDVGDNVWRNASFPDRLINTYAENGFAKMPFDAKTIPEVFRCGLRINPNGRCMAWREIATPTPTERSPLAKDQAAPGPSGPFVWITYEEVNRRINSLAAGLTKLGLAPGTHLGFYSRTRAEWQLLEHACYRRNMTSIALYDTLGPDAVEYILNHANVTAVMVAPDCLQKLLRSMASCPQVQYVIVLASSINQADQNMVESTLGRRILTFEALERLGHDSPSEEVLPSPDDVATIMYTSGTTGTPKGVVIKHSALVASIGGVLTNIRAIKTSDSTLSYLPLAHIYARALENAFFLNGASVAYFSGDTRKLTEDVALAAPTIFSGVPRVYERIHDGVLAKVKARGGAAARMFQNGLSKKLAGNDTCCYDCLVFKKSKQALGGQVHTMISGGGPLRPEIQEFLRAVFLCKVIQAYGLTETCAAGTCQLATDDEVGIIGCPVPAVEIKLMDASEFGPYQLPNAGEICIRGPAVSSGYYKDPEKTAEVFLPDGWFRTGDIGRVFPNGTFQIVDRAKALFKTSLGEYIAPDKIEGAYVSCSLISQIFVYGSGTQSKLIAVVVPDEVAIIGWADAHNVQQRADESLVRTIIGSEASQELSKDILEQIKAKAKEQKFASFEVPQAVILESEMWTVENDCLTPTMKVKRAVLARKYAAEFTAVYEKIEPVRIGVVGAASGSA